MKEILVKGLAKNDSFLWGATLGQQLLNACKEIIGRTDYDLLVVSFSGIDAVNASFIKAGIFPLLFPLERATESMWGIVAISDLATDVEEEFSELLAQRKLAALVMKDKEARSARVIGAIDEAHLRTLRMVRPNRPVTASELSNSSGESIGVTGWNNRLNELHKLGLIVRRKDGKRYRFSTTINEVTS